MSQTEDDNKTKTKDSLAQKLKKEEKHVRHKATKSKDLIRGLQIRPSAQIFDESGRQEPGEKNWKGFGFDIHPQVTFVSTIILIIFILLNFMFKDNAIQVTTSILEDITTTAGWC